MSVHAPQHHPFRFSCTSATRVVVIVTITGRTSARRLREAAVKGVRNDLP
jgi:hypothetical protein